LIKILEYIQQQMLFFTILYNKFTWFFICAFTFVEISFIFYIFVNKLFILLSTYWSDPNTPVKFDNILLNFYFNVNNLFNPFYIIDGKFKNLNVWPVGAVSNTIT
jgi:hypothetical protein